MILRAKQLQNIAWIYMTYINQHQQQKKLNLRVSLGCCFVEIWIVDFIRAPVKHKSRDECHRFCFCMQNNAKPSVVILNIR